MNAGHNQRRASKLICRHNEMNFRRDDPSNCWECANCGYVYGKENGEEKPDTISALKAAIPCIEYAETETAAQGFIEANAKCRAALALVRASLADSESDKARAIDDTKRLNWLLIHGDITRDAPHVGVVRFHDDKEFMADTLRQAIDAAMEGAQ